jgi:hypothetical protein
MEVNGITDVLKVMTGTVLLIPVDFKTASRLEIERFIERSETHLRAARFVAALESADSARALMDGLPKSSQRRSRVRLEIVSVTIHVAFGDRESALSSMGRALLADPDLELDPAVVSPKVMRVFHAARAPNPSTQLLPARAATVRSSLRRIDSETEPPNLATEKSAGRSIF